MRVPRPDFQSASSYQLPDGGTLQNNAALAWMLVLLEGLRNNILRFVKIIYYR